MDLTAILLEEIERSGKLIRSDALRRGPPGRVRVIAPTGEQMFELVPAAYAELSVADRPQRLALLAWSLVHYMVAKGASTCVCCTTQDNRPGGPLTTVALAVDVESGDYICRGQLVGEDPMKLEPTEPMPITAVPHGPPIVGLLRGDIPLPPMDDPANNALEGVLEGGLMRILPEHLWLSGRGRVLH